MTVKDLIDLLEDKETPLYLSYSAMDNGETPETQVKLNPRCELLCEAFNNCLVDSILPIAKDGKDGNDYGGGLIVYLKTEIKLLKKEV